MASSWRWTGLALKQAVNAWTHAPEAEKAARFAAAEAIRWLEWAGAEGFSQRYTFAIVLAEVLNASWMTWLLVVAWRMPHSERVSPGR